MDLNFNKVSYDGDLADFSEEELQELVEEFQTAQESNVAEFEKAAEALDEVDDSTIEDFEKARERLIGDITEAEAFDEVPLTEAALEDADFSELQEWRDFVAEQDTESDEDEDAEFDDMGKESPVVDGDEDEDFVEEQLGDVPGLNL
jgi:hypothetical protein